jgi:hypothetical protein
MEMLLLYLLLACSQESHSLDEKFYGSYESLGSYMSIWFSIDEKFFSYKISSDVKTGGDLQAPDVHSGDYLKFENCVFFSTSSLISSESGIVRSFNSMNSFCPEEIEGTKLGSE